VGSGMCLACRCGEVCAGSGMSARRGSASGGTASRSGVASRITCAASQRPAMSDPLPADEFEFAVRSAAVGADADVLAALPDARPLLGGQEIVVDFERELDQRAGDVLDPVDRCS